MTELRAMLGKERKDTGNEALVLILCIVLILFLLDLRFVQKYLVVEVSGGSMENTVFDGDVLYAERGEEPQRGDVVIIDVSGYRDRFNFSGNYIIKRLIALGGDAVHIENGAVSVRRAGTETFEQLADDYTKGETRVEGGSATYSVGEGEIFFLGDHRSDSTDSRIVGCFKESDIVGIVPEWAIRYKSVITGWENFRARLGVSGRA